MPRWRKPTKDEIRARRAAVAEKARSGRLRLPDAVAEMRYALGLTQADFAKMLGLTTRQIAELERGESNPTAETLDKVGRIFGFQIGFVPIRQNPSGEGHPREVGTMRKRAAPANTQAALAILDGAPDIPPESGDEIQDEQVNVPAMGRRGFP
jgi:putative transcriptional regulator